MLRELIIANSEEIIERAERCVSERAGWKSTEAGSTQGAAVLLTQVVAALAHGAPQRAAEATPPHTVISDTAALHGREMLRRGLTVAQVVSGYRDVRQVVLGLASDADVALSAQDYHVFNRCLNEALSAALTAYCHQRERDLAYESTERLGVLAHEMRNLLNTATLAFAVIRDGKVGLGGSTGAMLARNMAGLCAVVDRSVAEARSEASQPKVETISMREFMEEMQVSGAAHAEEYGLQLTVHPVDRDLTIEGDWQRLASAVSNLLQNAFRFSRPHGRVALSTSVTAARILIDVSDECGGLPLGDVQDLFRPFVRGGAKRSGLGLGLAIARRAAIANAGDIHVRDVPGTGCVFTIDIPRGARAARAV